jgi:hypothetical protein
VIFKKTADSLLPDKVTDNGKAFFTFKISYTFTVHAQPLSSLVSIIKLWPTLHLFSWNSQMSNSITFRNLIYTFRLGYHSMHWFSENLHLLNGTTLSSSVRNFIQIDHEMWKLNIVTHLAQYDCHCTDSPETHAHWTTYCKKLLHWILWKSGQQFSHWYKVTDIQIEGYSLHIRHSRNHTNMRWKALNTNFPSQFITFLLNIYSCP